MRVKQDSDFVGPEDCDKEVRVLIIIQKESIEMFEIGSYTWLMFNLVRSFLFLYENGRWGEKRERDLCSHLHKRCWFRYCLFVCLFICLSIQQKSIKLLLDVRAL